MRDIRSTLLAIGSALVLAGSLDAQAPVADDALYRAVDAWVEAGLLRYQIAGAALAIVRDGRIVHRRGFGFADIGRGYRVDPDTTVFHIASVTKLITAIAAIQQVGTGRLALDTDIRPMLGAISARGWNRDPITLHELLTHTAGIGTRWIGMAAHTPADVRPLADYLRGDMPAIEDRPGTTIRYSNHGYATVGWLTEIAAGMPWASYVEQRVLGPLGMHRSYARARVPASSHAVPYRYRRDTLPEPAVYEHASPAGAVHATATDLALLENALMDTSKSAIFPRGTAMFLVPRKTDGNVGAFAYGTFAYPNGRIHAASAGGEVPGFSTRLLMVPALRLGVVLMVNRKDPTLAQSVFDSVLARVAPISAGGSSCLPARSDITSRPPAISGLYRSNLYERDSFLRIGSTIGPTVRIQRDTGASLIVISPTEDAARRMQRVGDSTWAGSDGLCLSAVSVRGAPRVVITTRSGPIMLEPVGPLSSPTVVLSVLALSILALVVVLIAESWRLARKMGASARRWRVLTIALCLVELLFVAAFIVGLNQLAIAYDDRFAFGIPRWFSAALALPYLTLVMAIALAWLLLRGKEVHGGRWRGWIVVTATVAMFVAMRV